MPQETALTMVIFGATGDLSQRKLLPALFDLYLRGYLPKHFRVVGFARRDFSETTFRTFVAEALIDEFKDPPESDVAAFLEHCYYYAGNFAVRESYTELTAFLDATDKTQGPCPNRLFYLAVPPRYYSGIFDHLSDSGLAAKRAEGWTRILVEKPFGSDYESAQALDAKLGSLFAENQIFRIDHYLAKASVQNILAFRFSNALFEQTWSREHIERVHIRLRGASGVETRGEFYDGIGELRDMGQNHVLQMLALIAMDNPGVFEGEALRKARLTLLRKLKVYSSKEVTKHVRRAQYEGYRSISGVAEGSETETYFSVTAFIDSPRWEGVPFHLESGKCMGETLGDIQVWFKSPSAGVCHNVELTECRNVVTIGINPTQHVTVRLFGRKPGLHFELEPHDLSFNLPTTAGVRVPDAYAKVLYDSIVGDRTLFMSTEELEASWRFISPIIEGWNDLPLESYKAGSFPAPGRPSVV